MANEHSARTRSCMWLHGAAAGRQSKIGPSLIQEYQYLVQAMGRFPRRTVAKEQVEMFLHQGALRWVPRFDRSGHAPEPSAILRGFVTDRCPRRHIVYQVCDLAKKRCVAQAIRRGTALQAFVGRQGCWLDE